MSQRVPSWDVDDPPNIQKGLSFSVLHHPSMAANEHSSRSDYEVAELTWENGNVAMHGLGHPRIAKPTPKYTATGTLESIVDQATGEQQQQQLPSSPSANPSFISWLAGHNHHHQHTAAAEAGVDALVPCSNTYHPNDNSDHAGGGRGRKRARGNCASQGSTAQVMTADDTCELYGADEVGFTTTSSPDAEEEDRGGSPDTENTSFGGHDSVCHSGRSLKRHRVDEEEGKEDKREARRSSTSTKRSRAAAIHNQSERKRRDRINEKMKTLQKLVPNSSKTDKASMLDEVIDYMKQLQAQVQMMSRMMLPMAMPQLQMSMMANMAHMTQMAQIGLGLGLMDLSSFCCPSSPGVPPPPPPPLLHPSLFMPLATGGTWDAFSEGVAPPGGTVPPDPFPAFPSYPPQQATSMEAYSKMAALYQQMYQQASRANPKS